MSADETTGPTRPPMTGPDQGDPLAVYYDEVLQATNRFYASMERQRRDALRERMAQAPAAQPRKAGSERTHSRRGVPAQEAPVTAPDQPATATDHIGDVIRMCEEFFRTTERRRRADRTKRKAAQAPAAEPHQAGDAQHAADQAHTPEDAA